MESVKTLVSDLNAGSVPSDVDIVCAPVFVHIPYVLDNLDSRFNVSAQNCWTDPGAYTGEVSADMLVDMGVPWVITGHSERRALIGETSQHIGEKSAYAIDKGLQVIACVGESLPERESGKLWDVLSEQMSGLKDHISLADWSKVVIAYEPVWAIGTGVVATPDQAQVRHPTPRPICLENKYFDYLHGWMSMRCLYCLEGVLCTCCVNFLPNVHCRTGMESTNALCFTGSSRMDS